MTAPIEARLGAALRADDPAAGTRDWSALSRRSVEAAERRDRRQLRVVASAVVLGLAVVAILVTAIVSPTPSGSTTAMPDDTAGRLQVSALSVPHFPAGVGDVSSVLLPRLILLALVALGIWYLGGRLRKRRVARPLGRLRRTALVIVSFFVVLSAAYHWAFDVHFLPSSSMQPTLFAGDRVLSVPSDDVDLGDVVIYRRDTPSGQREFVGRVIAMGGDEVSAHQGVLIRNGAPEFWPGPTAQPLRDFGPVQLTEQQVFVVGDNHRNARDSRLLGPVDIGDVQSVVRLVLWNPDR